MGQTSDQQEVSQVVQPTQANPNTAINFLVGYKTYIVAVIMAVYALSGWSLGELSQSQAMTILFNAAGLTFIRSGIESLKNI